MEEIRSYREFWPVYLRAHRNPANRACHYLGALTGLVLWGVAWATASWAYVLLGVVAGYAWCWAGHFLLEGNVPATFGHPLWSFVSEVRMVYCWLTGTLDQELSEHGVL